MATCAEESGESGQAVMAKHLQLSLELKISRKEASTAAPRKLLPGGRFLSRLCYYFPKPNRSYLTLSTQERVSSPS